MFAKHRVLLLKVILCNTPKNPSRQGQECSSGVTDGKAIVTMIGPSTVQNEGISAVFGTSFHQRKLKSIPPTYIFWVELAPNHGKTEIMVLSTEPSVIFINSYLLLSLLNAQQFLLT